MDQDLGHAAILIPGGIELNDGSGNTGVETYFAYEAASGDP